MSVINLLVPTSYGQFLIDSNPEDQESFDMWDEHEYILSDCGVGIAVTNNKNFVKLTIYVNEKVNKDFPTAIVKHIINVPDKKIFFYSPEETTTVSSSSMSVNINSYKTSVTVFNLLDNNYVVVFETVI